MIIKHKKKEILVDDDFNIDLSGYLVVPEKYVRLYDRKAGVWSNIHRLIMGLGRGDKRVVDHINGDPYDNRKQNLRICMRYQNNMHRTKTPNGKYRNVYANNNNLWSVKLQYKGKQYGGGKCFKNRDEAISLAEDLRKRLFGEFA